AQRCCRVLVTRAEVDPQEEPTPHGQRGMPPFHLLRTQFGMRLIPLHPLHRQVLHALAVVHLSSMGRHPLEAMDRLESHGTEVRRARITDAPALTFQELCHGRFRELAAGHQGALPFRELPAACRTAPPFNVLVRPGPRPMGNVPFTGTIEPGTVWIWVRESSISLWHWRRQYHSGPPVAGNGPKDTEQTPVVPRYCSPGLPNFVVSAKAIPDGTMQPTRPASLM